MTAIARGVVATDQAPQAIGPYSQAISAGNLLFTSGQVALDPATGNLIGDDIATQTRQAFANLQAVLQAAGTDLEHVVKTTVFLKNISDFATVNEVYGRYFRDSPPARSTVQVANLPREALVEIEAIATLPGSH